MRSGAMRYGALANGGRAGLMISSFGDSGLPVFQAGHWDWQRPHSVQVAKSSMPFQVKSSTLPRPKMSSSPRVLEVDRLAVGVHRQQSGRARSGAATNATLIGARKMCRCLE